MKEGLTKEVLQNKLDNGCIFKLTKNAPIKMHLFIKEEDRGRILLHDLNGAIGIGIRRGHWLGYSSLKYFTENYNKGYWEQV